MVAFLAVLSPGMPRSSILKYAFPPDVGQRPPARNNCRPELCGFFLCDRALVVDVTVFLSA